MYLFGWGRRQAEAPEANVVNGLALPPPLVELLLRGRWRHPGDDLVRELIPFLREPIIFLDSVGSMAFESRWSLADHPGSSRVFHVARGSKSDTSVELPWLDVERAIFVAVNRYPGDDIGIALDYRTDALDP